MRLPLKKAYDHLYFPGILRPGLKPADVYVEIGAYTGKFITKSRLLSPECEYILYEPTAESYRDLLAEFRDTPQVRCLPLAVAKEAGERAFAVSLDNPEGNALREGGERRVRCVTLSDVTSSAGGRIRFLALNCEGAEYEILTGDLSMVDYISCEFHPGKSGIDTRAFIDEHLSKTFRTITIQRRGEPYNVWFGMNRISGDTPPCPFDVHGETHREECPICASRELNDAWCVNFARGEPAHTIAGRWSTNYYPQGQTQDGRVHCYSLCGTCGSLFLDPYSRSYWEGCRAPGAGSEKVTALGDPLKGNESRWKFINQWLPKAGTVIDCGCGAGGLLLLCKDHFGDTAGVRLIGADLLEACIEFLGGNKGIEARRIDIEGPLDDAPEADFLIFSEVFEHLQYPGRTLREWCAKLRDGGRLFVSMQSLAGGIPLRPPEDILIHTSEVVRLADRCGCRIIDQQSSSGKLWSIWQKN